MERILEPELMDDPEQALAYAKADFEKENQSFVELFRRYFPDFTQGHVLDLGCGPADIPIRFARAFPRCRITGVDGAPAMVRLAETAVRSAGLADRIAVECRRMQDLTMPERVDAIISNSLLHHLSNPFRFWDGVRRWVGPGGPVLVMDLLRPDSPADADAIVAQYAAGEPPLLRRDFYNSLLAAFTDDEVAAQLAEMNFGRLVVDVVDDRHWVAWGQV